MANMFNGASVFNMPLSSWNTYANSLTSMASMLQDAASYNELMNDWLVLYVTTMDRIWIATRKSAKLH